MDTSVVDSTRSSASGDPTATTDDIAAALQESSGAPSHAHNARTTGTDASDSGDSHALLPFWLSAGLGATLVMALADDGSPSAPVPKPPAETSGGASDNAPEGSGGAGENRPEAPRPGVEEPLPPGVTPLAPPKVDAIRDTAGTDRPVATGSAEPGAVLEVTWPDGSRTSAVADEKGHWTVIAPTPQGSGMVTVVAQVGDLSSSAEFGYEDITRPTLGILRVTEFDDTGLSALDKITSDKQFQLTVSRHDGRSGLSFEFSNDGGLQWTPTSAGINGLPDGHYLFRAVATDAAGNQTRTAPVVITLDATPPAAGALTLDAGEAGGSLSGTTHLTDFSLAMADREAGSAVRFDVSLDDGKTWQATSADQRNLADGRYQFRAVVSDAAGNTTTVETPVLIVDSTVPALGALRVLGVGGKPLNAIGSVGSTGDLALSVKSEDGATVAYEHSTDGGITRDEVGPSVSGLPEGDHLFRAVATDAAGNQTVSAWTPFRVQKTPPPIYGTLDLVNYSGTGDSAGGYQGDDTNLTFTSLSTAWGSTLQYEVSTDGVNWRPCDLSTSGVLDGSYLFRATATDPAGNVAHSNTIAVTVDTATLSAGTLTLEDFVDTGASALDRRTSDRAFKVIPVGQPEDSTTTVQMSLNGGGSWQDLGPTADSTFQDGRVQFRAKVVDAQGTISYTRTLEVVVDTLPPNTASLRLLMNFYTDTGVSSSDRDSQDGDFFFTVPSAPSGGGTTVGYQVSLDSGATWLRTIDTHIGLLAGDYLFRGVLTDVAGNVNYTPAVAVTVDSLPPASGQVALIGFDDTGFALDRVTQDNSFLLGITGAEAGAQVQHQRSVDGGITWDDTPLSQDALPDGDYQYRAVVTDVAGNVSLTRSVMVRIDATPPEAGIASFAGASSEGHLSQGDPLTLQLTGQEAGATVNWQMSQEGSDVWLPVTASMDALPPGTYRFRAVVTDAAGNVAFSNELSANALAPLDSLDQVDGLARLREPGAAVALGSAGDNDADIDDVSWRIGPTTSSIHWELTSTLAVPAVI
ncbi:Ig-like domain-containing protein [Roseateles amylovorans]|uniref:Ig-like domain-containing protein n=1 Tax=Roseateles amylovorans TaxID=2978473 RepID=A0ABY6AYU8_9BURK|nr:Ig-like domain-containing protein [Roseateles amylovorans]UXH76250.1 Ig-like domain-containing protein [Roseateles amylovorans]